MIVEFFQASRVSLYFVYNPAAAQSSVAHSVMVVCVGHEGVASEGIPGRGVVVYQPSQMVGKFTRLLFGIKGQT